MAGEFHHNVRRDTVTEGEADESLVAHISGFFAWPQNHENDGSNAYKDTSHHQQLKAKLYDFTATEKVLR